MYAPASMLQAAPSDATIEADAREKIKALLNEFHEAGKFPGASIGFVLPDGTNDSVCVGLAFKETDTAMTSEHRLMAGSTGKTFFAALTLQLVDEDVLDLDAKISTWLANEEWFERLPNANDITLRMLLNHTSGIPRYVMMEEFTRTMMEDPDRRWMWPEILAFVFDMEPLFPAGEGWSYADTNFIVAGYIVEKVTGESCYNQIYNRILRPNELWDIIPTSSRDLMGMSGGYVNVTRNLLNLKEENVIHESRYVFNPQFEWAGGGYACTTKALAQWSALLYKGDVLSDAMKKEMRNSVEAQLGPGSRYGLGLMYRPSDLGDVIGHDGYFPGYLTNMSYYADHDLALSIQVNTTKMSREMNPRTMTRLLDECAKAIVGVE
ncbi:MAG: serine hydrolase [Planctomycetota bacterium]|nr:serine hydrolase [Planctomycetota bacterium]